MGYLDDGTMVVVERGRDHIGSEVEATITSVMQTSVGRMIFSTTGPASTSPSLRAADADPAAPGTPGRPGPRDPKPARRQRRTPPAE